MSTLKTTYNKALTTFTHYAKGMTGKETLSSLTKANKAIGVLKTELLIPVEQAIKTISEGFNEQLEAEKDEKKKMELYRELNNKLTKEQNHESDKECIFEIDEANLEALKNIVSCITVESLTTKDKEGNKVSPQTNTILWLSEFVADIERALEK